MRKETWTAMRALVLEKSTRRTLDSGREPSRSSEEIMGEGQAVGKVNKWETSAQLSVTENRDLGLTRPSVRTLEQAGN